MNISANKINKTTRNSKLNEKPKRLSKLELAKILISKGMQIVRFANQYFLFTDNSERYIQFGDGEVKRGVETRGAENTIDRLKTMRLYCTKFICGEPIFEKLDPSIGVKRGIPKSLGILKSLLLDPTDNNVRLLLSLLSLSRAIPGKPNEPSLKDIEDPPRDGVLQACSDISKEIPFIFAFMRVHNIIDAVRWKDFHLSTKAGPNGLSVSGSILDAKLLSDAMLKDIGVVGGNLLKEKIETNRRFSLPKVLDGLKDRGLKLENYRGLTRKLSLVQSPERKNRVIAILDYWSQTALKPLHDAIFKILKGLENDFTFNQSGTRAHFTQGPYYSIDLKAATDRFPISLQRAVVEYLTTKEYSESWQNIMISQEFWAPGVNRGVFYSTGQPMGAYSSGAVFTLTHHFVVNLAKIRCNKPNAKYAILGDDIVINDKEVAEEYLRIIKSLGVDISEYKTHLSVDTYEFAKRGIRNGVEISGLQLNAFLSTSKGFQVAHELNLLCRRGNSQGEPYERYDVLKTLLRSRGPALNNSILDRMAKKSKLFLLLPSSFDDEQKRKLKVSLFVKETVPFLCNDGFLKGKSITFFEMAITEIKSRILDKGLGKTIGSSERLVKESQSIISSYAGLASRKVLLSIPFISLIYNQANKLKIKLQDLRDPMVIKPSEFVFDLEDTIIGFDPDRIYTKRKSERILASNATLVNQYKKWVQDYNTLYDDIVRDKYHDSNIERAKSRKIFKTKTLGALMPGFPITD